MNVLQDRQWSADGDVGVGDRGPKAASPEMPLLKMTGVGVEWMLGGVGRGSEAEYKWSLSDSKQVPMAPLFSCVCFEGEFRNLVSTSTL